MLLMRTRYPEEGWPCLGGELSKGSIFLGFLRKDSLYRAELGLGLGLLDGVRVRDSGLGVRIRWCRKE